MIDLRETTATKYKIRMTSDFKKDYKKVQKQHKDINKLKTVIHKLANHEELEERYRNHLLIDSKYYKNCGECHIENDWLLVYQYRNEQLILLLVATGSYSEIILTFI